MMAFVPDSGPGLLRNPVWLRLGTVLLILILGALFFMLSSVHSRHEWLNREPAPGTAPTSPGPVVPR
jgi:hypothetical protein